MEKFDFQQAIEVVLYRHGAQNWKDTGWQLETRAGLLKIQVHDSEVETYFAHPGAARAIVQYGEVDPATGSWNWHFDAPTPQDVEKFEREIATLLDQEKEAALSALARSARKLNAELRASGRRVVSVRSFSSNEFIATFPQGRPPR